MKKPRQHTLSFINQLNRPVFTTHEIVSLCGKSPSAVTQALAHLEGQGLIARIYRGVWIETGNSVSPYSIIPFLLPRQRAYVSFVSALHLHGIIEQIPQVITLASPGHTRCLKTAIGTFTVHQITPEFFKGFGWYKNNGGFLIAEPEKALVDSLYLSARKKKQFGYFPELHFPKTFSLKKARQWAGIIPDIKIRSCVEKKLAQIAYS